MANRTIILCADDFGQTAAICQGILQLVNMQRLSAVSCMVNGSYFTRYASALSQHQANIDIGLHLNLTEGIPLSKTLNELLKKDFPNLLMLTKMLLCKQLSLVAIEAEIVAQIELFTNTFGYLPHFIDGHQHVHHFPIVRQALLNVYQHYFPTADAYIRISTNATHYRWFDLSYFPKKRIIAVTGALALKKQLASQRIPHNKSFAGIYSFEKAAQYRQHFISFLKDIENNGLIMCHPGLSTEVSADIADCLYKSRHQELSYFASNTFQQDCEDAGVSLGKFQRSQ